MRCSRNDTMPSLVGLGATQSQRNLRPGSSLLLDNGSSKTFVEVAVSIDDPSGLAKLITTRRINWQPLNVLTRQRASRMRIGFSHTQRAIMGWPKSQRTPTTVNGGGEVWCHDQELMGLKHDVAFGTLHSKA